MVNKTMLALIILLVILNVIVLGFLIWFFVDFENCVDNQSPYCMQIICPDGEPATRTDADGNTQQST